MKKLLSVAMLATALLAAGCDKLASRPQTFQNVDLTGVDYAKGFTLTDHTGKVRTLEDFRGKLVVLFFGYTQCPDVCPTTMAEMATVMKELGPSSKDVQVLFVTLDPERDTQEVLAHYVPAFDKRFIGLRGTPEQTAQVAKDFKVVSTRRPGSTADTYTVDHTAASFVFDKEGRLRLFVRYGGGAAPIVHDLRQLL